MEKNITKCFVTSIPHQQYCVKQGQKNYRLHVWCYEKSGEMCFSEMKHMVYFKSEKKYPD
jgi:hypothetical protein